MRNLTVDEQQKLMVLTENTVPFALIEPTRTGLEKNIIDAIRTLRQLFLEKGFHDYSSQGQGQKSKVYKKGFFICGKKLKETLVSLYRPQTKGGDPRIWFTDLKKYVKPNELLVIFVVGNHLYILNCSDKNNSVLFKGNNLKLLLDRDRDENPIMEELLEKLVEIYKMGFVKRWGSAGPKAVGWTVEHLLGLEPNSSKKPDYKGIELKSHRKSSKTRYTLFSRVPKWALSRLKSSKQLLYERGRIDSSNRLALYNTLTTQKTNSHGLRLDLGNSGKSLHQYYTNTSLKEFDVRWVMSELQERLEEKHPETFWIQVDNKLQGSDEFFHYKSAAYSSKPNSNFFKLMLKEGLIEVDYTLSPRNSGQYDHGYLFKIWPQNLDVLFREVKYFNFEELGN